MRLGFLGTGNIARRHAAAAGALGHEISAGAARSAESPRWRVFSQDHPEARYFDGPDALLAAPDIDAVVCSVNWQSATGWLPALLAAGKPVLLEKPIALKTADVAAALASRGDVADDKIVAMNRRFYAPVRHLADRLAEGGLKSAEVTISENIRRLLDRFGPEIVPHILVYSSCHILDLALHLLGPLSVRRMYGHDETAWRAPFRSYNGLLETADGAPVNLAINADDPVAVGLRCRFDDHTLWALSPVEVLHVFEGYETTDPTPEIKVRRYAPKCRQRVVADATMMPGIKEQMAAFTSGVHGPAARPADALALLRLIDDIRAAAE